MSEPDLPLVAFSRAYIADMRKVRAFYLPDSVAIIFGRAVISTVSNNRLLCRCGFSWKPTQYSNPPSFFSHTQQSGCLLVHSLWTQQRAYPSYYPLISTAYTGPTVTTVHTHIKYMFIVLGIIATDRRGCALVGATDKKQRLKLTGARRSPSEIIALKWKDSAHLMQPR
jgi:hypothetical protein